MTNSIQKSIDNGVRLSVEEHKRIILGILEYVADFCEKNGLRYFLSDGTLIGAIRHQGFIPWDDDIDIRMPRPDLNKLIEIFNSNSENTPYYLVDPKTDRSRHYIVKIIDKRTIKIEPYFNYKNGYLGADVDIFPIDGSPDDIDEFYKWGGRVRKYNKAILYKKVPLRRKILRIGKDILCNRNKAVVAPFSNYKRLIEKRDAMLNEFPYDDSNYVGHIGASELFRVPKKAYDDYIKVNFEGRLFRVPQGYDDILKAQYGDYMQLPPEEEQVTHHVNEVYWINGEE